METGRLVHLKEEAAEEVVVSMYEGRSKSFAIQYDAQLTQAKQLYYFSV